MEQLELGQGLAVRRKVEVEHIQQKVEDHQQVVHHMKVQQADHKLEAVGSMVVVKKLGHRLEEAQTDLLEEEGRHRSLVEEPLVHPLEGLVVLLQLG